MYLDVTPPDEVKADWAAINLLRSTLMILRGNNHLSVVGRVEFAPEARLALISAGFLTLPDGGIQSHTPIPNCVQP